MTSFEKTTLSVKLQKAIDSDSSQCVKCALCLPHCPTYTVTQDENESPRGRIALFQAVNQAALPLTFAVQQHLDRCLGCRACERVCPAKVPYGQLLVKGRAQLQQLSPTPHRRVTRSLQWLIQHPRLITLLQWGMWGIEQTQLRAFFRWLHLPTYLGIKDADALLPPIQRPFLKKRYSPFKKSRGRVLLWSGCLGQLSDQATLQASLFLLRYLGYEVVLAPPHCCGALTLHAGQLTDAFSLAQRNVAFVEKTKNIDHVITLATACQTTFSEYTLHFSLMPGFSEEKMAAFSAKTQDILTFLQNAHDWSREAFSPLPSTTEIWVHTPCTRLNTLKTPDPTLTLLSAIPHLRLHSFTSSYCCGAAGTAMLEHPQQAQLLAERLLAECAHKKIDSIVTSNIGCALYLRYQLKKKYPAITLYHPVILLARALGF